jgi:hypothetical protein
MCALATALLAGCATTRAPDTRVDYDKSSDFSVYRTYGFPAETGTAVGTAMEARGYKYAAEKPDLLVNFFMNTTDRTEYRGSRMGAGSGYYGYRYGLYSPWPMYEEAPHSVTYKYGTINVDIVDAEKKQLIWEGIAEGRVSQEAMENPKVTINGIVTELMQQYPGKPNM